LIVGRDQLGGGGDKITKQKLKQETNTTGGFDVNTWPLFDALPVSSLRAWIEMDWRNNGPGADQGRLFPVEQAGYFE
jgi:hypothetical protein